MPKLKTHSGAKKRFWVTGKGKIKYKKSYARHILFDKPAKRMRKLRKPGYLGKTQAAIIKRLIPYA